MDNQNIDLELVNRIAETVKQRMVRPAESLIIKLSCLLAEFNIDELTRRCIELSSIPPTPAELEFLQKNAYYISSRNTYALDDYYRNAVLQKMDGAEISSLADYILSDAEDITGSLFYRYIKGNPPELAALRLEELVATSKIIKWCRNTVVNVFNEGSVSRQIRQEELLTPFKRLIRNFKGRTAELQTLEQFIKWTPKAGLWNYIRRKFGYSYKLAIKLPLFITGIGGTGKSTLIAKSIIDHIQINGASNFPFVYIDFDKPGFSIASIFSLAKEGLRQLGIQYDNVIPLFQKLSSLIDSEYGDKIAESDSRVSDRTYLYEQIFTSEILHSLNKLNTTVLVVFDSFEELQYRARTTEIENLFNFLTEITEFIPQLRTVFIGRSEFNSPAYRFQDLKLPGFDQLSASGFLESHGIADLELQQSICNQFGYNPLTLQLAASLVIKEFKGENITLSEVTTRKLFSKIDENLIQEQLVTRNLEHIHSKNEDVKKIAVPGILVRKINADVVQHVLAEVCGLGKISAETASSLFDELKKESFLFTYNGPDIAFRQDLRISLCDLIHKNPAYNGKGIHDAAVRFYDGKEQPEDKAEFLYHSLIRGDDASIIDSMYAPSMRDFIISSLVELPARAYIHFSRVLGLTIPEEKLIKIDVADWEAYMKMQVNTVFSNGDETLLANIHKQLLARKDRSRQRDLAYEEAKVYARLNDFVQAKNIINSDRSSAIEVSNSGVDLPLRAVKQVILEAEIYEYQFDFQSAGSVLGNVFVSNPDLVFEPSILFEYYLSVIRIESRSGKTIDEELYKKLDDSLESLTLLNEVSGEKVFDLLPKPYHTLWKQAYSKSKKETLEIDFLKGQIRADVSNLQSSGTFQSKYNRLAKELKTKTELEVFLKRNFDIYLKDISLPGRFEINLYDALKFIELHPLRSEAKIFASASKFARVKNVVTADNFINHPEIKRSMERLFAHFSSGKTLVISDVLDEEGHQYVNLCQSATGVHSFALAGYTYILEEMGVRFLQLSGTGSGALNTALMAINGSNAESKTKKLLEGFTKLDFSKLIDGNSFVRIIFKKIITNNFAFKIKNYISIAATILLSLLISSVLVIIFEDRLYWLSPVKYLVWFYTVAYLFVSSIIIYFIFALLAKANTGQGVVSGTYLHDWIKAQFSERNVRTIEDFVIKASKAIPGLHLRRDHSSTLDDLLPGVTITATEVVTEKIVYFPEMASLFRIHRDIDTLHPADFIRAAMSVPLLFDPYKIKDIRREAEEIKRGWLETVGEEKPPTTAYFIDASTPDMLRQVVLKNMDTGLPRFPSLGIEVNDIGDSTIDNSYDNGLPSFFIRLIKVRRVHYSHKNIARLKASEKGIGRINLSHYNWLNYFLTDEDKINMFVIGAQAATEFLLQFDWEEYKKLMVETNDPAPGTTRFAM